MAAFTGDQHGINAVKSFNAAQEIEVAAAKALAQTRRRNGSIGLGPPNYLTCEGKPQVTHSDPGQPLKFDPDDINL